MMLVVVNGEHATYESLRSVSWDRPLCPSYLPILMTRAHLA